MPADSPTQKWLWWPLSESSIHSEGVGEWMPNRTPTGGRLTLSVAWFETVDGYRCPTIRESIQFYIKTCERCLFKKKGAGSGIEGNYAQLLKKGHCLIKQVMENRFPGSTCGEFPCCQDTDVCKKFFWHSALSGTAISSGDERSVSEQKSCSQRGSGPCGGQWNHSQFFQIQSCCWTVLSWTEFVLVIWASC